MHNKQIGRLVPVPVLVSYCACTACDTHRGLAWPGLGYSIGGIDDDDDDEMALQNS